VASASRRRIASLITLATLAGLGAATSPALAAPVADPIVNQAAPALIAPANDKTTPVKDVVLQWSKVPYATKYEVQISPNGDFTNNKITLPNSGLTVAPTYEVPLSLPHDEYYWRVRGVDPNGHTDWSAERQFLHDWAVTMTILQTPTSTDPTFAWAPVPEASLYRVRIATDPTFDPQSTPAPSTCWTASTTFTPYADALSTTEQISPADCFDTSDLVPGTTYYYEVEAYDDSTAATIAAENAPSSGVECPQAQPECDALTVGAVGTFTWKPAASTAPPSSASVTGLATTWHASTLPGTPCDLDTACPVTPTFSWNAVPGASFYKVQVFRDPYGTNGYKFYDTDWPTLTPREGYQDAQAGHAYYWNVVAYASCDAADTTCTGPKFLGLSDTAVFAKRSDAPVLRSPAVGADVKTPWVTFRWDDYLNSGNAGSLEARNYHLQISTTKSFDKTVKDVDTVDMTQWTDPSATLRDGVYFWRVQALDESGNQLTWSAARQFTFDGAPPQFRITTKDGLAVTHTLHVTASEPDIVGNVSSKTVTVFAVSTKKPVAGRWDHTGAAAWTFDPSGVLVPGESYALSVSGLRDQAGNAAIATNRSVRTNTSVDDRSKAMHYSSTWSRASSSNAQHGTYAIGSGGSATVTVVGTKILVYGCKGPSLGTAVGRIHGKRQATVHERQQFSECGVLLWKGPVSSTKPHAVQFAQSAGSVALDAVKVG
jgi:hypothetical protein